MEKLLKISIGLNVALLALVFLGVVAGQRPGEKHFPTDIAASTGSSTALLEPSLTHNLEPPQAFHWRQLESANDYQAYVARLRSIGCPETTINDIVSGDARRAFAFKRAQLNLDGSGQGQWSRAREAGLVAGLLAKDPVPEVKPGAAATAQMADNSRADFAVGCSENALQSAVPANRAGDLQPAGSSQIPVKATEPVYPVAFRRTNLEALGFGANETAAIMRVQEQFVDEMGGQVQNPDDPNYLARWQTAQVNADDALRGALGSQAYMAFVQQQYYDWYEPQVQAAKASGSPLVINPAQFSVQQ